MERKPIGYINMLRQIDQLTAENIQLKSKLISVLAQLQSKSESLLISRIVCFLIGAAFATLVEIAFGVL